MNRTTSCHRLVSPCLSVFLLATCAFAWPVHSKEYNKSDLLDPDSQAKVNRALARSYREEAREGGNGLGIDNDGCGNLNVGNVVVGSGEAPREVVTVIRGDVINVSKGCD